MASWKRRRTGTYHTSTTRWGDASSTLSRDSSAGGEQHSGVRTLVLHLLPGALITAFYAGAAPVVRSLGFPSLMAILLAIGFVLIPFELGYLIYQARKNNSTLGSVVLYRQPVRRGQFVALVLGLLTWWGICSVLLFPPLDEFFMENVFSWVPGWFLFAEDFSQYSTAALLITWIFGLVVNGIAAPVVEEMYFRGYLLPRISRLGAWAPLVNTVLFSLYHLFTPWLNVGRIAIDRRTRRRPVYAGSAVVLEAQPRGLGQSSRTSPSACVYGLR
jgi:membrane protease YdiL (CAAX protease family)